MQNMATGETTYVRFSKNWFEMNLRFVTPEIRRVLAEAAKLQYEDHAIDEEFISSHLILSLAPFNSMIEDS
jgi:hypothetical protein